MSARRLTIEARQRRPTLLPASLSDFQYSMGDNVDPTVVLEDPSISLFSLDHDRREAIFVETPTDVNLSQVPFIGTTQYQTARSLIAVSYDTLHQLADGIPTDARRLILVYSTGRCGSTLVSHALNAADGVISLSESTIYTELVALRSTGRCSEADASTLVRDCTRVLCAGGRAGNATAWGLKFLSMDIELGDLFYHHFPEAKVVFLYRHAESYVRSLARAFNVFSPEMQAYFPTLQQEASPLVPLLATYTATHTTTISPIDLMVCWWASPMVRCIDLQRQGVPMLCARYEDLRASPNDVLDAIYAYCGVTVSDRTLLDQVLAEDSQGGTTLSQARAQQSTSILSDLQAAEVYRALKHYAPEIPADVILPHTFRPQHT